jgi:GT2 family glycosyltransferase
MRWISGPDEGQSDAINKGWKMAGEEIIAWLNSDDTYLPHAVETAVKYLNNHPDVGMVYGECHIVDECNQITDRCKAKVFDLEGMLCQGNMVPQPTVFLRRKVLEEVGPLDTSLHFSMDFDFWIRIALKFKIAYIPQYLANFRLCAGTKSKNEGHKFALDQMDVLDKVFSSPELPEELRALKNRAYSCVNFKIGTGYHSQRQMKPARKYLIKSIRQDPGKLLSPYTFGYLLTSLLWKDRS